MESLIHAHPAHKLLDRVHSTVRGVGFQFEVSARERSVDKKKTSMRKLNLLVRGFCRKHQWHGKSISSFGWPVICDENGVPEDSLDPLTDGHCRAAVQAGDCQDSFRCILKKNSTWGNRKGSGHHSSARHYNLLLRELQNWTRGFLNIHIDKVKTKKVCFGKNA